METLSQPKTNRDPDRAAGDAPLGLRERKKRETRQAIAAAALRLFERQGFQNTTIAQIAAAADVAPRTVSSYFPVKEELAFPDQREEIQGLCERLADRRPGKTALTVLREWIDAALDRWESEVEEMHVARRVIESEPELKAYERVVVGELMDALRVEVARDLDQMPNDLEPRIAAAATIAVFEVLADHYKQGPEPVDKQLRAEVRAEVGDQIDRAIGFITAGMAAMKPREA